MSEPELASVLFQVTNNHILNQAVRITNKHVEVGKIPRARKAVIPPEIKPALKDKERTLINLNKINADPSSNESVKEEALKIFKTAKSFHQDIIRRHKVEQEANRDNDLLTLLLQQPP